MLSQATFDKDTDAQEPLPDWGEIIASEGWQKSDATARLTILDNFVAAERSQFEALKDSDPDLYQKWQEHQPAYDQWAANEREQVARSEGGFGKEFATDTVETIQGFGNAALNLAQSPFQLVEDHQRGIREVAGMLRDAAAVEEENDTFGLGGLAGLAKNIYGGIASAAGAAEEAAAVPIAALDTQEKLINEFWDARKLGRPGGQMPWHQKLSGSIGGTTIGIAATATGAGLPAIAATTFGMNYGGRDETFEEFRQMEKYRGLTDDQVKDVAARYQGLSATMEAGLTVGFAKLLPTLEQSIVGLVSKKAAMKAGSEIPEAALKANTMRVFSEAEKKWVPVQAKAVLDATTDVATPGFLKNVLTTGMAKAQLSELAEEETIATMQWAIDRVYGKETDLAQSLWDTAISTVFMSGVMHPATASEKGFLQQKHRESFSKYAASVLDGTNKEVIAYKELSSKVPSVELAGEAADRTDFLENRAHWIKEQLGEADADAEKALRYAAVLKAHYKMQEALKPLDETARSAGAPAAALAATLEKDGSAPELVEQARALGKKTAQDALQKAEEALFTSDEWLLLQDEALIAKFSPNPEETEYLSPDEKKAMAEKIRSVLKENSHLDIKDLRALVKEELAKAPVSAESPTPSPVPVTPEAKLEQALTEDVAERANNIRKTADALQEANPEEAAKLREVADKLEGREPEPDPNTSDLPTATESVVPEFTPEPVSVEEAARTKATITYEGVRGRVTLDRDGNYDFTPEVGSAEAAKLTPSAELFTTEQPAAPVASPAPEAKKAEEVVTASPAAAVAPVAAPASTKEAAAAVEGHTAPTRFEPIDALLAQLGEENHVATEEESAAVKTYEATLGKSFDAVANIEGLSPQDREAALKSIWDRLEPVSAKAEELGQHKNFTEAEKLAADVRINTVRSILEPAPVDEDADVFAGVQKDEAPAKAVERLSNNVQLWLDKGDTASIERNVEIQQAIIDNPESTNADVRKATALRDFITEKVAERKRSLEAEKAARKAEPKAAAVTTTPPEVPELDRAKGFAEGAIEQLMQDFPEQAEMIEMRREEWVEAIKKTAQRFAAKLKARLESVGQSGDARLSELEDQVYSGLAEEQAAQAQQARKTFYGILKDNFQATGNPLKVVSGEKTKTPGAHVPWSSASAVNNWTKEDARAKTMAQSLDDEGATTPEPAEDEAPETDVLNVEDAVTAATNKVVNSSLESLAGFFAREEKITEKEAVKALKAAFRALSSDPDFQMAMRGVLPKSFSEAASRLAPKRATKASRAAEQYLRKHAVPFRKRFVENLKAELPTVAKYAQKHGIRLSERVLRNDEVTVADVILQGLEQNEAAAAVVATGDLSKVRGAAAYAVYSSPALRAALQRELDGAGVKDGVTPFRQRIAELLKLRASVSEPSYTEVIGRLAAMDQDQLNEVLRRPGIPESFRTLMEGINELTGDNALDAVIKHGSKEEAEMAWHFKQALVEGGKISLVNNFGLTPGRSQGLWTSSRMASVHVSPFLSKDLWGWTVLHEAAHALTDYKITAYLNGEQHLLTEPEIEALDDLSRLMEIANTAAQKKFNDAKESGMPEEQLQDLRRNLFGSYDKSVNAIRLREFVTEALNHREFQEFLAGIEDTGADGKRTGFSVLRAALNKILSVILGRKISDTSVLQRTWENGIKLAGNKERATGSMSERMKQQSAWASDFLGGKEQVSAAMRGEGGPELQKDLENMWAAYGIMRPFSEGATSSEEALNIVRADVLMGKRTPGELAAAQVALNSEVAPQEMIPRPELQIDVRRQRDVAGTFVDGREMAGLSFAELLSNKKLLKRMVAKMDTHGVFRVDGRAKSPEARAEYMVTQMVNNLTFIFDQVPDSIRERSKGWYKGANKIAHRWSSKYDVPVQGVAGAIAALSPQRDWYMNVSLAERVLDIATGKNRKTDVVTDEMLANAERIDSKQEGKDVEIEGVIYPYAAFADAARRLQESGITFDEMHAGDKALFIRLYDETYNPANFTVVTPEGDFGRWQTTSGGKGAMTTWGPIQTIQKALEIIQNPSAENISQQLGGQHKIRSFYNNIINPASDSVVTVDTHAVAAAYMLPLSGTSPEVTANFSGVKDTEEGFSGTYALIAEAYRRAAQARGVSPSEMQSITWEAIREIYTAAFKQKATNKDAVKKLWDDYIGKKDTYENTRQRAFDAGGGYALPQWYQQPEFGLLDSLGFGTGDSTYQAASAGESLARIREGGRRRDGRADGRDAAGAGRGDGQGGSQGDLFGAFDFDGRVAQSEAARGFEFVSPNDSDTDLTFDEAQVQLGSQKQKDFRAYAAKVDAFISPNAKATDALGDWADGAEPTTATKHTGDIRYEDLRISTALKSAFGRQKAGIPFKVDPEGEQFLYEFTIPGKTVREARDIVAAAGIEFRTLVEQNGAVTVYVFDSPESVEAATSLRDKIETLVSSNNYEYIYRQGRGEFLGSWTSREEGHAIFREVVGRGIEGAGVEGSDGRGDGGRAAGLRELAREAGLLQSESAGRPGDQGSSSRPSDLAGADRLDLSELGITEAPEDTHEHRSAFSGHLAAASDADPLGQQVLKKTPDQLKGARLFTALSGKVGFAIYPTGEIGSFFSHPEAGAEGAALVLASLKHLKANPIKGLWASSFNTRLVPLYTRMGGFVPVARVAFDPSIRPNWDAEHPDFRDFEGGRPSVVFYKLDPENARTMTAAGILKALPEAVPYEQAKALASAPTLQSEVDAKVYSALTGEPATVGFASGSQAHDFVSDNFYDAIAELKSDLVANYAGHTARYVVSGPQGGHYIEINPRKLAAMTQDQVRAVMREELIHAASGAVLASKNPKVPLDKAWLGFYGDLGKELTADQRKNLKAVYKSASAPHEIGAEYFRAGLQDLLYGTVTEAEMKTTAMQKIISLLKGVLDYFSGKNVSKETREVWDATAALLRKVDPQAGIPAAPLQSEAGKSWEEIPGRPTSEPLSPIRTQALGQLWQKIAEDPATFRLGKVPEGTKTFTDTFKALLGDAAGRIRRVSKVDIVGSTTYYITDSAGGTTIVYDSMSPLADSRTGGSKAGFVIDSSGTHADGTPIYQAAYAWAYMNDKVIVPDSSLSYVAELRKTSQMLSSALRFGTTKHMIPAPEMGIEGWKTGDSEAVTRWNIGLLASRESDLVFERLPDLAGLTINEQSGEITDAQGVPLSGSARSALASRVLALDPDFTEGAGAATLARALVSRASKRARLGLGGRLRDALATSRQKPLEKILYSEPRRLDPDGLEILDNPYVPEFQPTLFDASDRKVSAALDRVRSTPEFGKLKEVLEGRTYFSWTEAETLRQAHDFIDRVSGGDLLKAFVASRTELGMPAEQVVAVQGIALKRATLAARAAREQMATATNAQRAADLSTLAEHYEGMAKNFGDEVMEKASLAGQELRAYRLLADVFAPANWTRSYTKPIRKAQAARLQKEKLPQDILARIRFARREAANSTTARMQKVLDLAAGRGFKRSGATAEEIAAAQELARQLSSPLTVREQVMKAAVEEAVVQGMQPILDKMTPEEQDSEQGRSFLNVWKNRLRNAASKQLEEWIAERLKGGSVELNDTSKPELTDAEKEAAYEQKINEIWGVVGDLPLAEITFELARATIAVADTPYAGVVKGAKFDAAKSKELKKAVKMSITVAQEIRKSLGERALTKEDLKIRLRAANPSLTDDQANALSDAVETVYNEEVRKAGEAALRNLVKQAGQEARRVIDQPTIDRILPIINMGVFSNEEVYNALAPKYDLPVWNKETAAKLEAEAMALQELAEGSVQRGEAGQKLVQSILKATVEAGGSGTKLDHYANVAGALWTAGVLSRPQTQMVNATATVVSVFMEAAAEARGYQKAALAAGATPEQASEFYKDIMRAFRFSFGKDATNTSLRVLLEAERALRAGTTHHKSTKGENLQLLEMYEVHERVAKTGSALMDAIATGEWKNAATEAGNTVAGIAKTMAERATTLDAKGAMTDYLGTAKFVGRVMLATDAINAGMARNMKLFMERRFLALTDPRLADRENMTEAEIQAVEKEIQQKLDAADKGILKNIKSNAVAVADDEAARGEFGPAGTRDHQITKARRVEQLVEQQTYGQESLQKADNFAAESTFNGDAYGLVGLVMNGVFGNDMRQKFGPYGVLLTPINPFPRTASNLINQALNYSPYGFLRAHGKNFGSRLGEDSKYFKAAPEYQSPEFHALQSKAIAGTVALGTLGSLVALAIKAAWDDDDKDKAPFWFAVHGNGPKDPTLRKQWLSAGNKPYTLRVYGATMKYNDIPGFNLVLGALGTLHDQMVWGKKEFAEKDPVSVVSSLLLSVVGTTMNRQMLGGMSSLFDVISNNTTDAARQSAFSRLVSSYATGFTNPGIFRAFEQAATGETYETRTWTGWALQFVPMGQAVAGKERYNVLGEPIKKSLYEMLFERLLPVVPERHPVLTPLTEAGLKIQTPKRYAVLDTAGGELREMSESEFYDFGKAYGDRLSAVLTPALAEQLAQSAKVNPTAAQDRLDKLVLMARNVAMAQVRETRGITKSRK